MHPQTHPHSKHFVFVSLKCTPKRTPKCIPNVVFCRFNDCSKAFRCTGTGSYIKEKPQKRPLPIH